MATWFSKPIKWISGMELKTQPDNAMKVRMPSGPIEMRALYDGFVVYRPTGTAPEKGNLELVLVPDKWPEPIQKFFNPRYPELAVTSRITELPPGRVVYRDLPKTVIKQNLHTLIFEHFKIYLGDNNKVHSSLDFIPNPGPTSLVTLKVKLLEAWNGSSDPVEKQKKVDAEIDKALDEVFSLSLTDTLLHALPVQGDDLLCSTGAAGSETILFIEMRNLYGEPLNPHFYLRKIEKTAGDLTPAPPFSASDPLESRVKTADQVLPIRIPREGGVTYNGMTIGVPTYESPLIWTHVFNPTNGSHTTNVTARPGQTPVLPTRENAQRINVIWDTDHFWINKHAEIFQVPCELILATIYKEARPLPGGSADLHSIRLEEIKRFGPYPVDYENLVAQSKTSGSSLTAGTVETYWKLAGLWATHNKGLAYEPRKHAVKTTDLPKVIPPSPFVASKPIGTTPLLKKITWTQLAEIISVKPELIATENMVLPVLGKTKTGQYHYDLIAGAPTLGAEVARIYWTTIGGVRKNAGKEEIATPSAAPLSSYPLPTDKDWPALTDPADATKKIRWEQLLSLLALLKANGMKNVPAATYVLQPLQSLGEYSYSLLFAQPELIRILGVTADKAEQIMQRYFALMQKDINFVSSVGPAPGEPGVQRISSPSPDEYLTLTELRAISRIYPARISIGVGQILFDTAARKVIPWVKKHFGDKFFTDVIGAPVPLDPIDALIQWMWDNLWDNEELQIAFIAAYHKQNATIFWQPFEDNDDNKYKVGEMMTRFDFPRVAAAYNAGIVRKPRFARDATHPDVDWGLHTFGDYFAPTWSAISVAITRFDSIPSTDPKWARVRLRPDLETNSGMDAR